MESRPLKNISGWEPSRPFFSTQSQNHFYPNATHILGFCFDGTTSFRPGARFGPDSIRDASFGIETYSPYLDGDIADLNIYDIGNIPIHPSNWLKMNTIFHQTTKDLNLIKNNIKLLTLGGEHSISYGPIRLYLDHYKDLLLVHLDAHADLRDGYLEEKYSHASIIRRVMDHLKSPAELLQYGIRSGTKEEFIWMKENKTRMSSLEELIGKLEQVPSDRPIYLTLDLDYFDPSFFPGTGTPEPGGENFHSFIKLVKVLNQKNFVGADVVELSPQLDSTLNSSVFASKVCRELLLCLQKS